MDQPPLLLQLLDLFVLKGLLVLGPSPERILGLQEKLLPPVFHLSHGQTVLPGRLGGRGVALQDCSPATPPPLRRPSLNGFGYVGSHRHLPGER
jgi:hypothetical protein